PPPAPTLCPYTTLFRSRGDTAGISGARAPSGSRRSLTGLPFRITSHGAAGSDARGKSGPVSGHSPYSPEARSARRAEGGSDLTRSEEHTSELQSRFDLV